MRTVEDKIAWYEKRLEQLNNGYERALSRFSILLVLYSIEITVFSKSVFELLKNLFRVGQTNRVIIIVAFIVFLVCFLGTIYHAIQLVYAHKRATLNAPKHYYSSLYEEYKSKWPKWNEATIYEHLKHSYLSELESTHEVNFEVYSKKANHFHYAFIIALVSLVPFVILMIYANIL